MSGVFVSHCHVCKCVCHIVRYVSVTLSDVVIVTLSSVSVCLTV